MITIDHHGKQLRHNPVTKIRVRFREGRWFVEFKEPKKFLFIPLSGVWQIEGSYRDFFDAKQRAECMKMQGGYFTLVDVELNYDVDGSQEDIG
jgi:hypothetical protein